MKTIINNINSISGRYGTHEVFSDWVRMMSLALANACPLHKNKTWKERERAFKDTSSKYTEEEFTKLAESMAHLIKELEREPRDVLGEVYMAGGFGNNKTGQFFTPYHLSELTARLGVNIPEKDDDGLYRIYEPSCGAGGMIIAAVMELFEKGVNYQREVKVVAQDLDWTCVYMCHVQLSYLGMNALVVQGDTLMNPYDENVTEESHILRTPKNRGILL